MREIPVLFSTPMVRALQNTQIGRIAPIDPAKPYKGVTRRLNEQWGKVKAGDVLWVRETWATPETDRTKPGRVAYNADGVCGCWTHDGFIYHGRILEADGYRECFPADGADTYGLSKYSDVRLRGPYPQRAGWRPNIFMPRWACRIRLECEEDARREPLQEITGEEAVLEGVEGAGCEWKNYLHGVNIPSGAGYRACSASRGPFINAVASFCTLWQSLHTKAGERWEDNPTVFRVGRFRRIQ